MVQLCIGPFLAIGHFVPNVDLDREAYRPLHHNLQKRYVVGFWLSLASILVLAFLPVVASPGYVVSMTLISLYALQALIHMICPQGIPVGTTGVYLFSTRRYNDWLSDSACVVIQHGREMKEKHARALFEKTSQKVVVHFIGSGDNVSSYLSRHLHPDRTVDDKVHVVLEQPGISGTKLHRQSTWMGQIFNLSICLIPFAVAFVNPLLCVVAFMIVAPYHWEAFSIKKFATNGAEVINNLRQMGVVDSDIEVRGYSLGTLAVMEWFNQDVQNRGQKPEVDVVLDRGPRPNSLPEYAVDNFTLPGVALFLLSLVFVFALSGLLSLSILGPMAAVCLMVPIYRKKVRYIAGKYLYQFTGNWIDVPAFNQTRTKIFQANSDKTVPIYRQNELKDIPAFILDGGHQEVFDGDQLLPLDDKLEPLVDFYNRILH